MASVSSLPPEQAKPPSNGTETAGPSSHAMPGQGVRAYEHHDPAEPPGSSSSGRILFLDDDPDRARAFLGRHPEAVWVQTACECIVRLAESWDEVHLDHDLGGQIFVDSSRDDCGMEVVRWLCSKLQESHSQTWFFVHSHNAEAADLMVRCLRQHGYQAVYRPFGIDALDWFSAEPIEEPDQQHPPETARRAPALLGWLERQLKRFRRSARPRSKADQVDLPRNEPSCGSSNFDAESSVKSKLEGQ